ncbi:MAG: MetQ/NlpA family ABC transporter substrate-binding protein [Spirochaetales bacterium]|nr:MetQ/NlpA family ABC transporter substrate-binding protein [Spirochaetales bacterium]MBR4426098.1 MetQ/NlpA family ABC transporter substrate-binding protein [Spirochaetales bacterium]
MKKAIVFALVLFTAFAVFASGAAETKSTNKIVVGATPEPHAEMLNLIKDDLAAQGITLEVKEFTDYVTPNEAVESGEIDANFFQHIPYLESFNTERGFHLVNAGGIHIEPLALYSKKYKALADLPQNAKIAIPNDPTNEGRALLLLASAGLITLADSSKLDSTPIDITSNPKNISFAEVEAASLPRVLDDVDAAVINGNYAIPAGLSAAKDGLVVEGADSPYVNVVAVKSGNESNAAIQALVKALQSDKIKKWVAETYKNGEVVVVF